MRRNYLSVLTSCAWCVEYRQSVYSRLPVTWQQRNYRKQRLLCGGQRHASFFSFFVPVAAACAARPFGVCQNEYKLPSQHSSLGATHTQDTAKMGRKNLIESKCTEKKFITTLRVPTPIKSQVLLF